MIPQLIEITGFDRTKYRWQARLQDGKFIAIDLTELHSVILTEESDAEEQIGKTFVMVEYDVRADLVTPTEKGLIPL